MSSAHNNTQQLLPLVDAIRCTACCRCVFVMSYKENEVWNAQLDML